MKFAFVALLLLTIVFLQYRLWGSQDGLLRSWHLKKTISAETRRGDELSKNNAVLVDEINALKNDNAAIESQARNNLGMVKKGEIFYRVVPAKVQ
jgi:cell division protein FtsB